MIDLISSATISATIGGKIDAVSCRSMPRLFSKDGITRGLYFTHNAGVAGSSPAPATKINPSEN
jgi:hypothetical protein